MTKFETTKINFAPYNTIFHIRQLLNLKHIMYIFSSKGFLVIFLQIQLIYCYTAKFFHGKYYKFLIGNRRKAEIL